MGELVKETLPPKFLQGYLGKKKKVKEGGQGGKQS